MLQNSKTYQEQLKKCAEQRLDWGSLEGKKILVTGGTGLIGSILTDILLLRNLAYGQDIRLYLMGRRRHVFQERWSPGNGTAGPVFLQHDVCEPFHGKHKADYIIHLASQTYPAQYAGNPVGTIMTNVLGAKHILDYGSAVSAERCIFASSVEIYGENRGDVTYFNEEYSGYLDSNRLRAGYPESKRTAEALCQAYIETKKMDIVIPRISRVYGPGMSAMDNRAISQFIRAAAAGEDILLKSSGTQRYSFLYAADAAMAILFLLLYGKSGEAYNVAGEDSGMLLKDIAGLCADYAGTCVIRQETSLEGYSGTEMGLLDTDKLRGLGWESLYGLEEGIRSTIDMLRGEECDG